MNEKSEEFPHPRSQVLQETDLLTMPFPPLIKYTTDQRFGQIPCATAAWKQSDDLRRELRVDDGACVNGYFNLDDNFDKLKSVQVEALRGMEWYSRYLKKNKKKVETEQASTSVSKEFSCVNEAIEIIIGSESINFKPPDVFPHRTYCLLKNNKMEDGVQDEELRGKERYSKWVNKIKKKAEKEHASTSISNQLICVNEVNDVFLGHGSIYFRPPEVFLHRIDCLLKYNDNSTVKQVRRKDGVDALETCLQLAEITEDSSKQMEDNFDAEDDEFFCFHADGSAEDLLPPN